MSAHPAITLAQLSRELTSAHSWSLLGWGVITAVVVAVGVRLRGGRHAERYDFCVGLATLIAYIGVNVWWLWPTNIRWHDSLPIQLCDLAALSAPVALLLRWRAARAVLYFWGFALSTQGFITPVTDKGPDSGEFWMHWLNHGSIVGAAIYDLVVLRFRPAWRDFRVAVALGLGYLAFVFALNLATGWNYGYVGAVTPEAQTIVDYLGAWPLRVVWIALIAIAGMAVLMLPWVILDRIRAGNDDAPA